MPPFFKSNKKPFYIELFLYYQQKLAYINCFRFLGCNCFSLILFWQLKELQTFSRCRWSLIRLRLNFAFYNLRFDLNICR